MKHFVKLKLFRCDRYVCIDVNEITVVEDSVWKDNSYHYNNEYLYVTINTKRNGTYMVEGNSDVISAEIEKVYDNIRNRNQNDIIDKVYFALSKLGI